jgi:hypothetical protein
MPSDGKSSHGLWPGELKIKKKDLKSKKKILNQASTPF